MMCTADLLSSMYTFAEQITHTMNIITKFTVATESGIETLLILTKELAMQKYSALVEKKVLDRYITDRFNDRMLIAEVNSMSNQWLIVYAGDVPAGYARITSNGKKPQAMEGRRAIRIADFGILQQFTDPAISDSLLQKCLSVCGSYQGIWINEQANDPMIPVFEKKGFVRQDESFELDSLPVASIVLVSIR